MIELVGYIAGFLVIISYLPQVVKSWKTRKVDDMSPLTGILLVLGAVMWTVYGILTFSIPIIATNIVVLLCIIAIILVRFFPLDS